MRLYVLTLNFWDDEDQRNINFVRVYSTDALARQALADRALAGTTQSQQAQTAAQVASNVAAQRAQAASTLASLGQGGIGQGLGAAGQVVSAAMAPQQLYNQYASILFGTPSAQIAPDFRGTQSYTKTGTEYNFGIGGSGGSTPFKIGF